MAALSSCFSPKICTKNSNITVTPSLLGVSDIGFLRFPTCKKLQCQHLIAKSHLVPDAVVEVSSDFQNAASESSTPTSKTIHVKFQLHKECMFGDEILLVGDHPALGSWNPSDGIPMNWSDGHMWNVELDVPIETTMQFKFVLKQSSGEVFWQPGADRIFKSWESKASLVIAEDWENPEAQKISEEQENISGDHSNQSEDIKPNVDSNVMFSADTDYAKEKLTFSTDDQINSNKEMATVTMKNEEVLVGYQGQVLAPGLMSHQVRSEESSLGVDTAME